jgi:serine/threonine protein kinase
MPSLPDEREELPERVAHFRLLERLGVGGMGVVYRAQDEKLLRIVALKVLAKNREGDDTMRKRFLREARIAAGISHANVAAIYEAGEDEGRIYIAMELAHGTTLRRRLEGGPLEVREAVRIAKEIARGVGRAHAREVAHRDLKPDNVMVGDDGAVKVLDFGLAKPPAARPSSPPGPDSSSLTQVGRIVGTPGYMSPEQAIGDPVDVTTDVFSLGVILYELLTGRRPFVGDSPLELVLSTSRDTPTPASQLNPSVPPALEAILDRCLEKDPADRYSTADELLAALEGLAPDARPGSEPPWARAQVRGTMPEDSELYRRARSRIGTTVRGKYHLDRILGVGGMAVVFEATHRNLKKFALKMLHPEVSFREDVRKRFLREGYAANVLAHPGAVAVLDDDVAEDGAAFLVMELLEGAGLDALWERCGCRLTPKLVLAVACPLLEVLTAAHAKGIIHRDIKPPNVFLTRDGSVKVLDFGVARVRDALAGPGATTGTGILLGTAGFMAPEQAYARSKDIDAQTDVWAVGATMFTLLSGDLVHEGENAQQLVINAATSQGRSLAALAPDVPANVVELVERAIAFDKSARWPSADAMREAAEAAYLSMFGEAVSRAPLAELVQRVGSLPTPTPSSVSELSSSILVRPARRAPALPSLFESTSHSIDRPGFVAKLAADERAIHRRSTTSPEAPNARQRASGRAPRAFPMSTAKPVSSDALDSAIATPRKERSAPWAFRATFVTLIAGASLAALAIDGRLSWDTAPEPLAEPSPAEQPSARSPPPEPEPSVAATTEPPASASASASTPESPSARASASTPARSFAAPSPAPRASVPSRTASVGSPKQAASSRAAPPPPRALAGSTGRLNVGATGGWCDVTVDGVARGATPVAGIELSAGPHVVTCTSTTGTASATVIVPADETVRYRFSL